jgi:truncated hemoglobin YjbI
MNPNSIASIGGPEVMQELCKEFYGRALKDPILA